jgi:hemoglobin
MHRNTECIPKPDITGSAHFGTLAGAFPKRVRKDERLVLAFDRVAHTNWESHLRKTCAFWETVSSRNGDSVGNRLSTYAAR